MDRPNCAASTRMLFSSLARIVTEYRVVDAGDQPTSVHLGWKSPPNSRTDRTHLDRAAGKPRDGVSDRNRH